MRRQARREPPLPPPQPALDSGRPVVQSEAGWLYVFGYYTTTIEER